MMPIPMPTPPIIDDDARMVPMPPPPPPHMGPPMGAANADAQIHRMINDMDPFMRRRSAFPAMPSANQSSSAKRTTTSGHRDSQGPLTVYGFKLTKCLGRGTFSKVFLGVNKTTEEQVALKFIKNRPASKSDKHDVRVQRETNILTVINHPNIIRIMKRADTKNNTVLVMEYAQGGELLSYIRQHGRLREEEARRFFREVISAIDYCHQHGILHRDLKLENIMLDQKKRVKIIDFGFANIFFRDRLLDTFCGSPFYAAPEMVNGVRYRGPEVDIWSMGVILFFMLIGRTPFEGENLREIYQKISQGMYTIPPHMNISNAAADLIRHMLNTNKETRINMTQVRLHPWVNEGFSELPPNYCKPRPNHPPVQPNMYIVRQVASRFKMTEMQVLEGLNNNQMGESPIVGLYYLFEDYLAKRHAEKLNRRSSRNQDAQPHPRDKLSSRMSMPVGERPSGSSSTLGKNGASIDPRYRRSFHPGNPAGPPTPKHDRRSAYTLADEQARGRGSRKLSSASIRRESSAPLPAHPTPYPQSPGPYGPVPPGHTDYFDRPKHLSHIPGESPTTNSFWSSFLGNSRSKVNNKSSNFEQNSLGNISVGIMDSSAPNLEKKARKSALFHSIIMRARKSMPFLIRGHASPPPSPKVPSPMPPTTMAPNGSGLTPGYSNNASDVRHSAVLSAPSTPMSPGFPAPSNMPYTALPPGIPPPASGPPLSPVSHPAMHLMHPMPPTKHVIRPALSHSNVMSSRGTPELTAAAAAAAALAPPPMSTPVTPMVVPAPMTPTSTPYVPAPVSPGGAAGKAPGKPAERGVIAGLFEDRRHARMSVEKVKDLILAVSKQFHFKMKEIHPHLFFCTVEHGKYRGQTFDVEITTLNPGLHTICMKHQKGNWITFKKMTNRMFKSMDIDR
ncbi:hypothetical protein IWQ62_001398 [Dispira parvispora]|uniref:Protein kinase domain-containing protein n=1 Tax=Dispira parvispora TaxID=1520584 RepID=A0A9W8AXY5_9FUNG|nr:hypothetical protein IWQ62_001398 [Dispira parvispora]